MWVGDRGGDPPPLATGSKWLALYGVEGAADNLIRITVDGSSNNTAWLKVHVHRSDPEVITWEQIPTAKRPDGGSRFPGPIGPVPVSWSGAALSGGVVRAAWLDHWLANAR